jgi:hypothetical protein
VQVARLVKQGRPLISSASELRGGFEVAALGSGRLMFVALARSAGCLSAV